MSQVNWSCLLSIPYPGIQLRSWGTKGRGSIGIHHGPQAVPGTFAWDIIITIMMCFHCIALCFRVRLLDANISKRSRGREICNEFTPAPIVCSRTWKCIHRSRNWITDNTGRWICWQMQQQRAGERAAAAATIHQTTQCIPWLVRYEVVADHNIGRQQHTRLKKYHRDVESSASIAAGAAAAAAVV